MSSIEARVAGKTPRNLHGVFSSVLEGATRETPPLRLDNPAKGVRIRQLTPAAAPTPTEPANGNRDAAGPPNADRPTHTR